MRHTVQQYGVSHAHCDLPSPSLFYYQEWYDVLDNGFWYNRLLA